MSRLAGKAAIVVGAGQTPGDTIGNGRATALLFAREGARVLCVDRDVARAEETAAMISDAGGEAHAFAANIMREDDCKTLVAAAVSALGRIDILHNNVGGGGGDADPEALTEDRFDFIMTLNIKAMWMTIKHTLPVMRDQGGGAIVNISSLASIAPAGILAYELSKAAVNKLTTSVAAQNARDQIRCNAILPGLIDTPRIANTVARMFSDTSLDEARAARARQVPIANATRQRRSRP